MWVGPVLVLMFFVGGGLGAFVIYWIFVRVDSRGYTERLGESVEMQNERTLDEIPDIRREQYTPPPGVIKEAAAVTESALYQSYSSTSD